MDNVTCNSSRITWPIVHFPVILFVVFFLSIPVTAEEKCMELLTQRCETCHYLTRVCQKVEKERSKKSWFGNPKSTWKRIMKNMVKQGAQLNKAEEKILVDCLSEPGPKVLETCNLKK